jgi:chromosome partitioning protein
MKIVAVVSQKGGAGKTTLAVHLAVAAARAGYTVVVIDLDQQATAAQWADWRTDDNVAVVAAPHGRLLPTLEEARRNEVDLVIIDSPPAADSAAVAAAKAADLVLIPTRPSAFDLHAIKTTSELIKLARKPGFVVLNGVPPRASGLLEEVAAVVHSLELTLAPVCLVDRAAFRHAVVNGQSAQEYEPGGKAAAEVESLYAWTCGQLDLSTRPVVYTSKRKAAA